MLSASKAARLSGFPRANFDSRRFEPFIEGLKDQVVYLGYDLNPSAIASLEEDAKQVNADAKTVFAKIEDVTKTAEEYVLTLKPE